MMTIGSFYESWKRIPQEIKDKILYDKSNISINSVINYSEISKKRFLTDLLGSCLLNNDLLLFNELFPIVKKLEGYPLDDYFLFIVEYDYYYKINEKDKVQELLVSGFERFQNQFDEIKREYQVDSNSFIAFRDRIIYFFLQNKKYNSAMEYHKIAKDKGLYFGFEGREIHNYGYILTETISIFIKQKDIKTAINHFKKLVLLNHASIWFYSKKIANQFYRSKDFKNALKYFELALNYKENDEVISKKIKLCKKNLLQI